MDLSETVQFVMGCKHAVQAGRGPAHHHDGYEIVYHQRGRGTVVTSNDQAFAFGAHSVEVMPQGWEHVQHQTHPGMDYCVLFHARGPMRSKLRQCVTVKLSPSEYPANELAAMAILPRPADEAEQRICDCRLTAALLRLLRRAGLMHASRPPASQRQQLACDAHEHIRMHWRGVHRIAQVADALGVSVDYLRHVFREQYGMTVHDFVTQMRVEHAKDLLRNSRLPQKAIAGMCGFADIQQFSRRFRQITVMAPGKWRSLNP